MKETQFYLAAFQVDVLWVAAKKLFKQPGRLHKMTTIIISIKTARAYRLIDSYVGVYKALV